MTLLQAIAYYQKGLGLCGCSDSWSNLGNGRIGAGGHLLYAGHPTAGTAIIRGLGYVLTPLLTFVLQERPPLGTCSVDAVESEIVDCFQRSLRAYEMLEGRFPDVRLGALTLGRQFDIHYRLASLHHCALRAKAGYQRYLRVVNVFVLQNGCYSQICP